MSLKFDWSILSNKDVIDSITQRLNQAANSDEKADSVGGMKVIELNFGTQVSFCCCTVLLEMLLTE